MFVYLEIENDVIVNEVVSYDENTQKWAQAIDDSKIIGVVVSEPEISEDKRIAKILFAGSTYALADRTIPNEGGVLCVTNGRVYVEGSTGCGLISPSTIDAEVRNAGSLVLVHLK